MDECDVEQWNPFMPPTWKDVLLGIGVLVSVGLFVVAGVAALVLFWQATHGG